jgi:hypothetical protein
MTPIGSTSVPNVPALDKLTYINVGANGTLSGKLGTTAQDIEAILAYVKQADVKKIVLHFHGGLVSTEAGELTATTMVPMYKEKANSHPIVFIWETGFLETVEKNIREINRTKLFQKVLAYVVQQIAKRLHIPVPGKGPSGIEPISEIEAKIRVPGGLQSYEEGARGGAKTIKREELPVVEAEVQAEVEAQLESELVQDPALVTILREEVPTTPLLDQKAVVDPKAPGGRGFVSVAKLAIAIGKIVVRIIERYLNQRDHGFGPTTVEEILRELYLADFGAWVWSGMKEAAERMWLPNDGTSGRDLHGGRYLLDRLAALQREKPDLIVDLVGHSAGSIAICHLLKTSATFQSSVKIRNVIFMAPACTTALFRAELVQHQERFSDFRMFTMNDQFETKNHLVEVIYDRSLLYLISGILEPDEVDIPLAGMIRFDTGAPPFGSTDLKKVKDFLFPDAGQRLALALTSVTAPLAPLGFRSNAARHQDFNTDQATLESLVAMIRPA